MDKKPFGLTGLSGSGKTSLIAKLIDRKIADELIKWTENLQEV